MSTSISFRLQTLSGLSHLLFLSSGMYVPKSSPSSATMCVDPIIIFFGSSNSVEISAGEVNAYMICGQLKIPSIALDWLVTEFKFKFFENPTFVIEIELVVDSDRGSPGPKLFSSRSHFSPWFELHLLGARSQGPHSLAGSLPTGKNRSECPSNPQI